MKEAGKSGMDAAKVEVEAAKKAAELKETAEKKAAELKDKAAEKASQAAAAVEAAAKNVREALQK